MSELKLISGVKCYEKDGVVYLNLEDVARGLGFTQVKNGVEYVRWERIWQCLGFEQRTEHITTKQLQKLIQSTNRIIERKWYDIAGISIHNVILTKEQETIDFIADCFRYCTSIVLQKKVGNYKIDLYFPEYNIAVECDEFGHSDRNQQYEEARQKAIEKEIGCKFIRYNPDSEGFVISSVISEINKNIFRKIKTN